jgi:hypothetical protein
MTVTGTVDAIIGQYLSGWVQSTSGTDPMRVRVRCLQGVEEAVADISRRDLAGLPGQVRGFRVALPAGCSISGLADGSVVVEGICGDVVAQLNIWATVLEAARIETIETRNLRDTLRFVNPRKRFEIQRAASDFVRPWAPLQGAKRPACVITYANDSSAWFPYFYMYYSEIVEARSIYVITPNPQAFENYDLGGVISLDGFPYDDNARAQIVSGFAHGLLAFYQWTIVCDVDEIIIPNPLSKKNFIESLQALEGATSITRGFDVVQLAGEPDFDFTKSVLDQRRWAVANSAMCKPHFARKPVVWSGGYHYCDYLPIFEPWGSGFFTLHLKWACSGMRREVARIVEKTSYSDKFIATYSLDSVKQEVHPRLSTKHYTRAELGDGSFEKFEEKFLMGINFDPARGLWIGGHFLGDGIVDLWS